MLIDRASVRLLGYYFPSSETARRNPIENHWTTDWDAATIIQALEEYYPLRPEDRHLATSSRWQQVVIESRKKARNPAGTTRSNVKFQRDLNGMIQGDREYHTSPTLSRLCEMVARIMYQWEAMTAEVSRMGVTYPAEPHQPPAG